MKIRDPKSIIVIAVYLALNAAILAASFGHRNEAGPASARAKALAPEYTVIHQLQYFHVKDAVPQMSLSADLLRSQGEAQAEFEFPRGVYNLREQDKTLKYNADRGQYKKARELLTLTGAVKVRSDEGTYEADRVSYYFKKDLMTGKGNVRFDGEDPRTRDHVTVASERLRANPGLKLSTFFGAVRGRLQRKKKHEGTLTFASRELQVDGNKSLAQLVGDVRIKRDGYDITSGKADVFLENYNKSLKYFVLNDDVKVAERLQTPEGVQVRKAFAERLEGFGKEQKMVLSGAPRVEMGEDVIKGYRITIRENTDLVEVDDAMSDVQVKREKRKE
jgi:lipopolysaccharide export system protein LptA